MSRCPSASLPSLEVHLFRCLAPHAQECVSPVGLPGHSHWRLTRINEHSYPQLLHRSIICFQTYFDVDFCAGRLGARCCATSCCVRVGGSSWTCLILNGTLCAAARRARSTSRPPLRWRCSPSAASCAASARPPKPDQAIQPRSLIRSKAAEA